MAKEGSVAPKERINIKYVPATGDALTEVELPLKMMVMGNFKGHVEAISIEDRQAVSVDKNNFIGVMRESNLTLATSVPNKLVDGEDSSLAISLSFESLSDFSPDAVVNQVPELKKLMELREALVAVKGPLGNIPSFRSCLQQMLSSSESRQKLLAELDLLNAENAFEKPVK